ncbi:MAG: dihydroorotase family protein [Chitinophagaceae bacterium]|nr:dihydroorotase family protein [Chitinophagaceae bacterium]
MYDLVIKNARIVRPGNQNVFQGDIAIKNEKIVKVAPEIEILENQKVYDAKNLLCFPGLVDAHMHTGIYNPLAEDAVSESKAAAMGGVTTSLNYIRTGKYYLNKTGPYREFYPEVLEISKNRFYVDYAYHIAPIHSSHIKEIPLLIEEFGVTSFKIFMFYGNYGLHGSSQNQKDFLMLKEDEYYDVAHFEFIMRELQEAVVKFSDKKEALSLSLHCETAEIMRAYTKLVQEEGKLKGLRAYSAARPPHSEGLAIFIAGYLAHETELKNINLLHLTSKKAVEAALMMQQVFPHIHFKREVTLAHLLLDYDCATGLHAKVNPPIRSRNDVEYLWKHVLEGNIDWVCSDHACCKAEFKLDALQKENVWLAKSGFGGTEMLLSGLYTEGRKRGLSLNKIAELLSRNPAQRFGCFQKGDIAEGYDADLVLMDPDTSFVVSGKDSPSSQGYSVFEGMEFYGKIKTTFLRGHKIYENGIFDPVPKGKYLFRPYGIA